MIFETFKHGFPTSNQTEPATYTKVATNRTFEVEINNIHKYFCFKINIRTR